METAPARLRGKASWLISKTAVHAQRLLGEALTPVGGRGYEFAALATLDEFGPASQMDIARRCGLDRSDIHAIVTGLVDHGFARRTPDPHDRRRNVITITGTGRTRLDELDGRLGQVQDTLTTALTTAERRQLVDLLSRILDSATPPRPGPDRP